MNDELEERHDKSCVDYFKLLSQPLHGGGGVKNTTNSLIHDGPSLGPRFEPVTSRERSRSANQSTAMFDQGNDKPVVRISIDESETKQSKNLDLLEFNMDEGLN